MGLAVGESKLVHISIWNVVVICFVPHFHNRLRLAQILVTHPQSTTSHSLSTIGIMIVNITHIYVYVIVSGVVVD